jgi:hypothetical protein
VAAVEVVSIVENKTGSVYPITSVPYGESGTNPATPSERDKAEIAKLRSQHEDYKAHKCHWDFLLHSYEGGPSYVSKENLFKHSREHQADFDARLERAHYQNYCQPIVDYVPEFIFNQPIDRKPEVLQKEFEAFAADVDLAGTDINKFFQAVAEDMRLYGHVFVQVDKPAVPAGVDPGTLSVQDAKELGVDRPYAIRISPLEVLDWRTDRHGNFKYIKRCEYVYAEDARGEYDAERYHEWTRFEFKITTVDVSDPKKPYIRERESKPNIWKVVPFVAFYNKRSKSNAAIGLSAIQDIAYQNRSVFNKTSLIDEFLYKQCFNILAMEKDTTLPEKAGVEGEMGTSNVLEYTTGVKNPPAYLSPPADPAQFIQSEREAIIQEMYRQAAQDVASELFAVSNRSGDAAKQAFGRGVPVIAKAADSLQNGEVQVFRIWCKVQRAEWKGKVAYKDSYDLTNLQDLLLQLTSAFNSLHVMAPTFVKEEWKRIVRELDGRIPHEQLEKIYNEIDAMKEDEIKELFMGPKDLKAAAGLPSTANMVQGKKQSGSTDKKRSLATGDKSSSKEANPDVNKRANGAKGRS